MRNHFSRHRKTKTWKINGKRCSTQKGNRENRVFWEQKKTEKVSFAEVYKDTKNVKEAIDTENKERIKEQEKKQIFKGRK